MINGRLKKLIEPYLFMNLTDYERGRAEEMFEETYLVQTDDGQTLISLCPLDYGYISFQFSTINGAFVQTDLWEEVKRKGKKV